MDAEHPERVEQLVEHLQEAERIASGLRSFVAQLYGMDTVEIYLMIIILEVCIDRIWECLNDANRKNGGDRQTSHRDGQKERET